MDNIVKEASEELRKRVRAGTVRCNCGGPQYGTDHSPDCQVNLAWDQVVQETKDRRAEERG
jgi:hypothetical protein